MPQPERTSILRVLVPLLIVVVVGGLVAVSMLRPPRQGRQAVRPVAPAPAAPAPVAPGATPLDPAPGSAPAGAERSTPDAAAPGPIPPTQPAARPTIGPGPTPVPVYSVRLWPVADAGGPLERLGSLDPGSGYQMEVRFSPFGAGIESITLTNHYVDLEKTRHEVVQEARASAGRFQVPLAVSRLTVENQTLELFSSGSDATRVWRQLGPGHFEATLLDEAGNPAVTITRRYTLSPGSFQIRVEQRVASTAAVPLAVAFTQFGPVDLPVGVARYGGDMRRVRFGYVFDPAADPAQRVASRKFLLTHDDVVGPPGPDGAYPAHTLWPNKTSVEDGLGLVWVALTSRYFAAVAHPLPASAGPGSPVPDKRFAQVASVERSVLQGDPLRPMMLRFTGPTFTLAPGAVADLSLGLYAGPTSPHAINREPGARALGLDQVVVYTFGGPCAFCTFQPITHLLRAFLGLLHDYVLRDWSLAIIVLVLCVRTLLHPITKWSQVNLMRFGKQMQRIAPKQKQLQERYRDDPRKLREEMAALMRQEQVSYAGMLGCLPMFLQTPIWIALFAMLYFTFELRHEPAFFGLFQAASGGRWHFLADLAEPDRFVPFGRAFHVPLLSGIMGPIDSLNILPLLLGVIFFVQQKYLTPTPTASMSPEQEAQMRMMRVMSVVMFPLFMYNVPSGLALYTMTNSLLGIVETRYIRAHVDKLDLLPKAPRQRSALMERLRKQMEARQQMLEQMRAQRDRQKRRPGT